jgi:hypothetical protein
LLDQIHVSLGGPDAGRRLLLKRVENVLAQRICEQF